MGGGGVIAVVDDDDCDENNVFVIIVVVDCYKITSEYKDISFICYCPRKIKTKCKYFLESV